MLQIENLWWMQRREMMSLSAAGTLGMTVSFPGIGLTKKSKDPKSMKTLGMIGGTSWHSTIEYYRHINEMVQEKTGKLASPQLLLYSINVAIMDEENWSKINSKFIETSKMLEEAGVDAIIFCAITTHRTHPEVTKAIDIPVLHIADAIADEARRLGISDLGLLGTKYTMQDDFISRRLTERHGMTTVVPEADRIEPIHRLIVDELVQGEFTEPAREFLISEMDGLRQKGAEGMILGCTEFPILVRPAHYDLPLLDTTRLHARKAADFLLS